MNKLYILCGFPFAGKSTIAKSLEQKFGFGKVEMKKYFKKTDKDIDWEKTQSTYIAAIKQNLKQNKSVIVDTVGYNKKGRDDLRKLAREYDAETFVIYINTPLAVIKKRWQKNKQTHKRHDVTDEEFENIIKNFEIPTQEENLIIIHPGMKQEEIVNLFK